MPGNNGELYYILTGTDKDKLTGKMTRLEDSSESRHLWYVNAPEGYTSVQFSDTETPPTPKDNINGRATDTLTWGTWKSRASMRTPAMTLPTAAIIGMAIGVKSDIRDVESGKKVDGKDAEIVKLDTGTFTPQTM